MAGHAAHPAPTPTPKGSRHDNKAPKPAHDSPLPHLRDVAQGLQHATQGHRVALLPLLRPPRYRGDDEVRLQDSPITHAPPRVPCTGCKIAHGGCMKLWIHQGVVCCDICNHQREEEQ